MKEKSKKKKKGKKSNYKRDELERYRSFWKILSEASTPLIFTDKQTDRRTQSSWCCGGTDGASLVPVADGGDASQGHFALVFGSRRLGCLWNVDIDFLFCFHYRSVLLRFLCAF